MLKSISILFLFFMICPTVSGQNKRIMESLSFYSSILGQEVKYSVILPEDYYKSNKKYPVVYLLHGLGDDESSWIEYGYFSQIADKVTKQCDILPMIFIMPQGFRNYYVNDFAGTFLYQDMFVKELIPTIDSTYHTIADKSKRATMGYSMGGFGALVIPLKYPELFAASVPLSVSIRTDEQYIKESSSGWDAQWGRLFGGVGTIGESRLTDYYKKECPLHMIQNEDIKQWKDLRIYIDSGDDEETLASSNDKLHMALLERQIPHEYRVRNGGHEFSYWREAVPNGLRFISDAFQGKSYKGDLMNISISPKKLSSKRIESVNINEQSYPIYLPLEYKSTTRQYPVIYVMGDVSDPERELMTNIADLQIENANLPPFMMVFINKNESTLLENIVPFLEKNYRARSGYRFRSLMVVGKAGETLKQVLKPEQFATCILMDPSQPTESFKSVINEIAPKSMEKTWFFVGTSDKSNNYQTSETIRKLLREKEIYHEYRVMGNKGKDDWKVQFLDEAFSYTLKRMHR